MVIVPARVVTVVASRRQARGMFGIAVSKGRLLLICATYRMIGWVHIRHIGAVVLKGVVTEILSVQLLQLHAGRQWTPSLVTADRGRHELSSTKSSTGWEAVRWVLHSIQISWYHGMSDSAVARVQISTSIL